MTFSEKHLSQDQENVNKNIVGKAEYFQVIKKYVENIQKVICFPVVIENWNNSNVNNFKEAFQGVLSFSFSNQFDI
ncbi:hypothetical protein wOo_05120 [Wolbachia endosymbiont of Onchocerca ochengi]|uniref:hypothetical protein n=1 Tax=unclassified Wolbachia TaxID=2640676 RepID=UPI00026DA6AE|nr:MULTISPECIES: hypothetical protein [unclassified Wolbachia]CCF78170.1 hypothetical protein wOo_05120 [Wolbachia endosymbiont of Onchocerca ochengi]